MRDSRKHYAIELIESVLMAKDINNELMLVPSAGSAYSIARSILPYCLEPLSEKEYLPLNRNYKPLGLSTRQTWADYHDPKYQSLILPSDKLDFTKLKNEANRFYFFNDESSPIAGRFSTSVDKATYMFRMWLAFRCLGMKCPVLTQSSVVAAAKRLNLPADSLCSQNLKDWNSYD